MLYRALLLVFCAASLALSAPFTSRYFSGAQPDRHRQHSDSLFRSEFVHVWPCLNIRRRRMSGFTNGVRCGRNTLLIVWAGHTTRNQPECSWSGWGASAVEGITVRSEATGQRRVLGIARASLRQASSNRWTSIFRGRAAADPQGFYLLLAGGNDRRDAARISDVNQRTQAALRAVANIAYSVRAFHIAGSAEVCVGQLARNRAHS